MYLIGKVGNTEMVFGQGNTLRTVWAAGKYNADERNATLLRVVKNVPKGVKWFVR